MLSYYATYMMKRRSEGRVRLPFHVTLVLVCIHAMDLRACVTFVLLFISNGAALRNGG